MIKKILLIAIIVFSVQVVHAQWEPLNPKPSYHWNKKVKFVTEQVGFIINGWELLQTVDSGGTWFVKQQMPDANDMQFVNNTGYIACNNGIIYKSVDGGESWMLIPTGVEGNLHTISVIDSETAIAAVGNLLVMTDDGGTTWTTTPIPFQPAGSISAMCFTSATTGHVGTSQGALYRTIDGGATWSPLSGDTWGGSYFYHKIYFVNENLGFASQGFGDLKRTTDGGETWTLVIPYEVAELVYDIYFINNTTGYACAEHGAVYTTTDSGATWVPVETPDLGNAYSHLYGIYTIGGNIFTVGMNGSSYRSTDGGSNFNRYAVTYSPLHNIVFADATTAYAISFNDVFKSTDSGNNWQFIGSPNTPSYITRGLEFVNANVGYTIMANGLQKTTDGGLTWNFSVILFHDIDCMEFIDATTGFVSGGYTLPMTKKTTDGGATWQTIGNLRFKKMQFLNVNVGYAVAAAYETDKLYKTIDGGTTWNEIYDEEFTINDFHFINEDIGFFAGSPEIQRKTIDGGLTWQEMPTLNYMHTKIIRFADANTGYAVSDYGEFYKTVDGGVNWIYDTTMEVNDLVYHGDDMLVVGGGGKILRKESGVSLSLENIGENSNDITLYPNPVTDSFTINAGRDSIESIVIYDLSGRKITSSGIKIIHNLAHIDLAGAASGIYIADVVLNNGTKVSKKIIIR